MISEAASAAGYRSGVKSHGLRKAALRRLAERGGTTKELQALGGHKTLAVLELYTAEVEQAKLAKNCGQKTAQVTNLGDKPMSKCLIYLC